MMDYCSGGLPVGGKTNRGCTELHLHGDMTV